MLMVSPVNPSIGVRKYFPAVCVYISASQTRLKPHMNFGTLLHIILRLALLFSIFIIPLALFCQVESVVLPSMQQKRMHVCGSVLGPVSPPTLYDTRLFRTTISLFTTFKYSSDCELYCMG